MNFIDPETLEINKDWSVHGSTKYWLPNSVRSVCGYKDCGEKVTFTPAVKALDQNLPYTACMQASCPACKQISKFIAIGLSIEPTKKRCDSIWQYPVSRVRDLMISELPEQRIFKSYKNAIDSFNQRMYALSLVACGRVVEGIGKTQFPNASSTNQIGALFKKLLKELRSTSEYIEILQPLLDLGEALRVGRNPGGHFDLAIEPDRELAGKVIDLTEFLIRYVYIISTETSNVNDILSRLEPDSTDEDDWDY